MSIATVSNVLNNPAIVADGTRARVEQAIDQLGFFRNHSARQLRSGRSLAVGLVVLAMDTFYTELASGVEDVLADVGCVLILCNTSGSAARQEQYLRMLAEQRVRGVIITPVDEASAPSPSLEQLRRWATPLVYLVGGAQPDPSHCAVGGDYARDAEVATEHLLELGHRRLAFINGPHSIQACADRDVGIRRAFAKAGLDPEAALVELTVNEFTAAAGQAALAQLLRLRDLPTAAFAASDMVGVGVMRGLLEAGLRVPEDMALVGVGDVDFAAVSAVPLTTVRYPAHEMGRAAAELLFAEERDRQHRHRAIRFPPKLVVRQSTVGAAKS